MFKRRWIVPVAVLVAVIAVRAAVRTTHHPKHAGGSAKVTVHTVSPAQGEPGVTGSQGSDLAIVGPRSHSNGLLLVFLPATGSRPACCTLFLTDAAGLGYHVIALSGVSRGASLSPVNGIPQRLDSLVSYLAGKYPAEDWRRFVNGAQPAWSSIVMSGHSQGGGEAVLFAASRKLRGVVALSSPIVTTKSHRPPAWLGKVSHGATRVDRIIAFVHGHDPFYGRILADWSMMGLGSLGPSASVDGASSPYGHTHQLVSSAPLPHLALAAHDSTALDSATPRCPNGSPRYAPVWDYMLEVAGGLAVSSAVATC